MLSSLRDDTYFVKDMAVSLHTLVPLQVQFGKNIAININGMQEQILAERQMKTYCFQVRFPPLINFFLSALGHPLPPRFSFNLLCQFEKLR